MICGCAVCGLMPEEDECSIRRPASATIGVNRGEQDRQASSASSRGKPTGELGFSVGEYAFCFVCCHPPNQGVGMRDRRKRAFLRPVRCTLARVLPAFPTELSRRWVVQSVCCISRVAARMGSCVVPPPPLRSACSGVKGPDAGMRWEGPPAVHVMMGNWAVIRACYG